MVLLVKVKQHCKGTDSTTNLAQYSVSDNKGNRSYFHCVYYNQTLYAPTVSAATDQQHATHIYNVHVAKSVQIDKTLTSDFRQRRQVGDVIKAKIKN